MVFLVRAWKNENQTCQTATIYEDSLSSHAHTLSHIQSTLILFAAAIVTVANGDDGCEFCPNGITFPTLDINGTTCSDLATMVIDDPTMCFVAGIFEIACCPGNLGDGEGCDFCPDGVKYPEATVEEDGETATCAQLAIAAPFFEGENCTKLIELGTPPCCPASAISSMIAFIATAWIGYLVVF